jgi:hypothetical protein
MWSVRLEDDESDDAYFRRIAPPENELPVALPQNVLLARTPDVAAALLRLQVYSTGVSFDLVVRARPSVTELVRRLDEVVWMHGPQRNRFMVGVELSDGRRASNLPSVGHAEDVLFAHRGSAGGEGSACQTWWLHPLPPEGPLRLVVRCDDLGISETAVELDGTAIRRASERVVVLWPWEAPRSEPEEQPAPSPGLPLDSWFAAGP